MSVFCADSMASSNLTLLPSSSASVTTHDGFPAGLAVQLVAASEIDGIVQRRADHILPTDRTRVAGDVATAGGIDAGLVDGAVRMQRSSVKSASRSTSVSNDMTMASSPFLSTRRRKCRSGVLNRSKHVLLAAGSIQKESEGDR